VDSERRNKGLNVCARESVQGHDIAEDIALLEGDVGAGVMSSCPHGSVPVHGLGQKGGMQRDGAALLLPGSSLGRRELTPTS